MRINAGAPSLCVALHGLNIKSLSLRLDYRATSVIVESITQSLSSLKELETLSFEVNDYLTDHMWFQTFNGLNIKSIRPTDRFGGWYMNHAESSSRSLPSLTHLETLCIAMNDETPGLWNALHGLNIKSLSLSAKFGVLNVDRVESMLQSLSSLTQLETLSIGVIENTPGLWNALHGLNIKSLGAKFGVLNVDHVESMPQSL
ncbi:hypothetical protein DPMN_070178 [Dreissena polymorpha]|uniref:RNI-like protein n=1 Tax=Dreissena polymorpha TaxID=45954 RepID=A0A9D4BNQ0_DREPO|nr:hypothetical protein DPMN_070178 [Dreissena polymorpha]